MVFGLDLDLVGNWARLRLHLSCLCRLRTVRCTGSPVKSQIYCPKHILAYGSEKTCLSLVMGSGSFRTGLQVVIYMGWGGLSTILRSDLQCWGLRVRAWTGAWTPWHEWNGLVLLVPGVQARHVFSGHPVGHTDSWIAVSTWWYGLTALWHCSKNWKMKDGKMVLMAQPLLESRIGAYIEGWLMN
jgi:hypothetical protein